MTTWPPDVPASRCAPRGEREQRPAAALREQRDDPRYLRRLIGESRAELVRATREIAELLLIVRLGALERERVPHDVLGERRVLGALLLGRASLRDVAGVRLEDWAEGHRRAAGYLLTLLELEAAPPRELRPATRWPRSGPARRARLERLVEQLDQEAAEQIAGLPWPGEAPAVELAEVRRLARVRRALGGGSW